MKVYPTYVKRLNVGDIAVFFLSVSHAARSHARARSRPNTRTHKHTIILVVVYQPSTVVQMH